MSSRQPLLGVTMGDPAGIGSEIIVQSYPQVDDRANLVVLGDFGVMEAAVDDCDSDLDLNRIESVDEAAFADGTLDVVDFGNVADLQRGDLRAAYGAAALEYVEEGIELAMDGEIDAMVNAPMNKEAISMAGSEFNGHTDLLAARTSTDEYSMMLIQDQLVVTHVTVHVPLREAIDLVSTDAVLETIQVTEEGLKGIGVDEPSIAVAGLNPHAGEGDLGEEDAAEIEPAVEQAQESGIDVTGPLSADNLFNQGAAGKYDGIVAMYHDQGHIPIYIHGMLDVPGAVSGVNMTIGLPIIRTSTIHGTGFDIAGKGIARPDSIVDAIEVAAQAAEAQR